MIPKNGKGMEVRAKNNIKLPMKGRQDAVFTKDIVYNATLLKNMMCFIIDENKRGVYLTYRYAEELFEIKNEAHCEYFEPDDNGDVCHAGKIDECPNHGDCSAEYDVHGYLLLSD